MNPNTEQQIDNLLRQIYDEDQDVRIRAINRLGDIGDELCLKELRELLNFTSKEQHALIIAVGKLKKKLGIK